MNIYKFNSDEDETNIKDEVPIREGKLIQLEDEVPMGQGAEDCLQTVDNIFGYDDAEGCPIPDSVLSD